MSLAEILSLILAVLKAPGEIRALILLLSKTPEEKRQSVMARVQKEFEESADTGRPGWGD